MRYVYSKYWRTWARTIGHTCYGTVEVDLTPINGDWERVASINIRRHNTHDNSVHYPTLPDEVLGEMTDNLDEDTVDRLLLFEDFFRQIDWDKYDAVNNGGAPFDKIRIDLDH